MVRLGTKNRVHKSENYLNYFIEKCVDGEIYLDAVCFVMWILTDNILQFYFVKSPVFQS